MGRGVATQKNKINSGVGSFFIRAGEKMGKIRRNHGKLACEYTISATKFEFECYTRTRTKAIKH